MAKIYSVQVGPTVFRLNAQTPDNPAWLAALAASHRQGETFCLCDSAHPVALSIKLYNKGKPGSSYGLACWPGTGLDHEPDCRFFGEAGDSAQAGEAKPAFEEIGDDKIRVFLARPTEVTKRAAGAQTASDEEKVVKTGPTRQQAPDGAILNRLWRMANLNFHDKQETSWFVGSLRLMHEAKRFVIDRSGTTLDRRLLLGCVESAARASAHNADVLAQKEAASAELMVIGRLKMPTAEQMAKSQFRLALTESHGLPKILIAPALMTRFIGERALLKNVLRDKTGYVIVIARIMPAGGEWWKCVGLSGFAVSPAMIPVESGYELAMERHLVAAKRRFVKPMHVQEMDDDGDQRPDFMLFDTKPRTMIEVWGMQTPVYLASKEARLAKYKAKAIPLVSWMADRGEPIPALPLPTAA